MLRAAGLPADAVRLVARAVGCPELLRLEAVNSVWRRYARCRWDDPSCSATQADADVAETNQMLRAFVRDLRASGVLERPGNGAFVYSCNEHVAGLAASAFTKYEVGGRTMRDALAEWWAAPDDAPAARHTHLPCELWRNGSAGRRRVAHHGCNPSCDAYKMKRRLSQECPCSP